MTHKQVLVFDQRADWYAEALSALCPGYAFAAATDEAAAIERGSEAQVLVALAPPVSGDMIAAMPRLEWVQALTTGVDNLLTMPELAPQVVVTNCRGIHGPQMSELAILLMLALGRKFPAMVRNQSEAVWQRWSQPLLAKRTVCIVGLGAIAEDLDKLCASFEMRVTGVSDGRSTVEGFTAVYRRAEITRAVAEADFVVVVVPYSSATHHLVGAEAIAAMRPDAFLINLSRGGCVDEEALLAALASGAIGGAGLDVFQTEPLPAASPFWRLPNVIVTPHIGGMSDTYHEQALPIVAANLNAYARSGADGLASRIERTNREAI